MKSLALPLSPGCSLAWSSNRSLDFPSGNREPWARPALCSSRVILTPSSHTYGLRCQESSSAPVNSSAAGQPLRSVVAANKPPGADVDPFWPHYAERLDFPEVLGIDFGGTGIKGAPVDITTGKLIKERIRIPTPAPATPESVAHVIDTLRKNFEWEGPIGVGMPSVVKRGVVHSAANIDKTWIEIDAQSLYERVTGCNVAVLNDADSAAFAEMEFGAGRALRDEGVVLLCTFGTGIGTALFVDGVLVPNLEMGHIEIDGQVAEKFASGQVREREDMSWRKWAVRVNEYLKRMEHYTQPDLIIIGGGVSKKEEKFLHLLETPGHTPIVAAALKNEAGIVGAAAGGARILHARRAKEEEDQELRAVLLN